MNLISVMSCMLGFATLSFASTQGLESPTNASAKIQSAEELAAEAAARHQKSREAEARMHLLKWAGIMAELRFLQMREAEMRFQSADKAFRTRINGIPLIREDDVRDRKAWLEQARQDAQSAAATYLIVEGYQRLTTILQQR